MRPALETWVLEHAVEHVSDDGKLADALLSTDFPASIRKKAGERIFDRAVFRRVLLDAADPLAFGFAMECVDKAFIATPEAQGRLLAAFRSAATAEELAAIMADLSPAADLVRFDDQKRIADALLAKDGEDARRFAQEVLFDEAALLDVALKGDESLGGWVLDQGPKPETALSIALGAESVPVQCRAVALLDREDLFANVASKGPSRAVRLAGIRNLTGSSSALLETLAEDADEGVAQAAIRRLREVGAKRAAATLEKRAEEVRKAQAERAAAERVRIAKEDQAAEAKLQADILAVTGALQVHSFRHFLDQLASHPKMDAKKTFRFSGRVTRCRFGNLALEVPNVGEMFSVTVKLAETPTDKPSVGDVVTACGVYKAGSAQTVTLTDGAVVCRGVP